MEKIRKEAVCEPEEEKRIALTVEMLEIWEKNLWLIGGLNAPVRMSFVVVNNRLGNVPFDTVVGEILYSIPSQYFIKEQEQEQDSFDGERFSFPVKVYF